MNFKNRCCRLLFSTILAAASFVGAPMRPEEVDELMQRMNRPKLAHTLPDESHKGDDPPGDAN